MSDDVGKLDVVLIKKAECLSCAHLAPDFKSTHGFREYKCRNDRNCPAATYNIALGVDLLQTSEQLARAWHAGNADKIAAVMTEIKTLHRAVQDKVITLAKAKMRDL